MQGVKILFYHVSFLQGFRDADKFILAQTPLPNTVQDFLSLVYQADVSCIVCLDDVSSKRKVRAQVLPVLKNDLPLS